jgi:cytochrome c
MQVDSALLVTSKRLPFNLKKGMRFVKQVAMLIVTGALVFSAVPVEAAGNSARGAVVFNRCAICHNNTKAAGNKIGPDLFDVVGRKAGTYPGFSYSPAMRSAGFVWTAEKLDAYIVSPQTVVPGNKMAFSGISNAGQRSDLIAYLATLK